MNKASIEAIYYRKRAGEVWDGINKEDMPRLRCLARTVKLILLHHDPGHHEIAGRGVEFKKKSLGCGVYEVWMEPKK